MGRVAVVGVDEVGRGAIAGPVMVGAFAYVCEVGADGCVAEPELPAGIRDSKLVSPKKRESLFAELSAGHWTATVGQSSAAEIDEHGIMWALGVAAARACGPVLERLSMAGVSCAGLILDGNVDYASGALRRAGWKVPVEVRIKGDQDCVSAAAASVLAKVTRDRHMLALHEHAQEYGWASNKGYGSAQHRGALAALGLHPEHRASWNLQPQNPRLDLGSWG